MLRAGSSRGARGARGGPSEVGDIGPPVGCGRGPGSVAPLAAERALLARAWHGVYRFFYAGLKGGTALLFSPLFRVRAIRRGSSVPPGGVILCPNHQGYLDPAFVQIAARRRVVFVMTNDFYSSRYARWFFRLVGALPLGAGRQALTTTKRAAALLRLGYALVVFPEGRLSEDGSLHRGQRGIALLARRGRAPVIPIGIEGSRRAWHRGARWMRRAHVRIAFGAPVECDAPAGRENDQRFADTVMERIAELRDRLASARP